MNITYWLRKQPQPTAILADEKRIEVGKNGRAWRDLTATIKAMEPSKLTALDGQGNVLRSIVLESEEDEQSKSAAASPEMSDLHLFAKLLAEAYDKGTTANQPIIDSAMQFVERQGVRLLKAEAEIERLRAHIHKLNLEIARLANVPAPTGDGDGGILGSIVAGIAQGQIAAATGVSGAQLSAVPKGAKKP